MKKIIEFTRAPIVVPIVPGTSPEIGACVEFHGIVREQENGQAIPALFYEAYESMARMQLERIMDELNATHPCDQIHLIHRLGLVPVGEPSLYLRVQAKHRQEAFHMAANLVTRMKEDVPIWKRPPRAFSINKSSG